MIRLQLAAISKSLIYRVYLNHSDYYPSPINLSYMWSFGSIAGLMLGSQIITGVLLAMHYNANIYNSFADLEHIMRDVVGGYGLRYVHANGASMFFLVVYIHIARGLYYGSYFQPRTHLWSSGVILFFLMMAAGFMGYVLPWGQMSFWGATVITNMFSAIPLVGDSIVQWLWGGYSVNNPTLNRFFSFHFVVPFIILGLAGLHLVLLHEHGSNNPLGIEVGNEKIPFFSYFIIKDVFTWVLFAALFAFFVVHIPNYLGHPDNYIEAQPLVTPTHIVPEWYFLPFYAILRTIPNKLGGVIAMVVAIIILLALPLLDTSYFRSSVFKPSYLINYIFFVLSALILGWIGQSVVEFPYIELSIVVTLYYFGFFVSLPVFSITKY
jgi:quinol-cytochrome oxidoreductase complex cytochrome b subunit